MSSQKTSKPTKPLSQMPTPTSRSSLASSSSSVSSHLAMVELKQRVLNSLSKLADRDTHQIAVEDLEKIIHGLSNDGVSMLLNCLYDATNDPKPAVKKEGLRLLAVLCTTHTEPAATHLTKIISHIVKRLKDSDSQVRDACRDTVGSLAGLYLKGSDSDGVVALFVKSFFEVMSENNKTAQSAASMCLAKMIDCTCDPPLQAFQKLCTRVCKYLNSLNFLAKGPLLHVVSSLCQVGAITPQCLESLLQTILECLGNSEWTTRKAAADALIAIAMNISNITPEEATSTLNALEACRFDKIKPVRDSMNEALLLWKKIAGKGDGLSDENNSTSDPSERKDLSNNDEKGIEQSLNEMSLNDSSFKGKGCSISDKAVGILKKKAPALTDKELNAEFFQKLETRGSGELPVEVILPRRFANHQNSQNGEESSASYETDPNGLPQSDDLKAKYKSMEKAEKNLSQSEGLVNNKGNWLVIQRQLLQLERQQGHLMNMLQDFMGGSHDNMVTLENRVRGLERVVEDMARDLSISTGRRGGCPMPGFEGSSNRPLGKYNGFTDISSGKLGRGNDGRIPFGDRVATFDGVVSMGLKGRSPSWRSDPSDAWDFHGYGKSGQMGSRRAPGGGLPDLRPTKTERAWENGSGPVRFGEGPSARSVWQASKDEATLEAIRYAGEDNGASRSGRVAIPEMTAEALQDDDTVQDRDPVWTSWSNAMDALQVGDMDSAFSEMLSTGDDLLLVKLMDKTGPVIDQLSNEVASEVLHAVSQFLMDQNLFELCLYWIQQLTDIVAGGEHDLDIPAEVKREILLNLHEVSSSDLPEDWEGSPSDELLSQLASGWDIDLRHFAK